MDSLRTNNGGCGGFVRIKVIVCHIRYHQSISDGMKTDGILFKKLIQIS